jgi:cobalt-zinc-cadmium efflux system outer membrane protein
LLYPFISIATASPTTEAAAARFNPRQAAEFALRNNGNLKALREEKGVREAAKIKAGLLPNPVLEIDGSTGELTGSAFDNTLWVGISQEFLTAGKRDKRLSVAEKELEGFGRQVENAGRLLSEEVKTTFYDLLLARKRVELAERSVQLNRQLLDVAKLRFEAGDIPELEVNMARVEAARSEGRKSDAERELYPARARLIALMGLSPGETADFDGSLEGAPFTMGLPELKALARVNRPDIKALAVENAKGDAEIALAKAERIPNVTIGFGYQRENSSIDVSGEEVRSRDNLIGLKLSIPIPLFDRNQAGVKEALSRKGSAEHRWLYALQVMERETEAAFFRLKTAEKSLAVYTRNIIPQLEENLKLVQEAYRLGEVGILTVIEEQKTFYEVNDAYLAALYNRQTALIKLETAVGCDVTPKGAGGEK